MVFITMWTILVCSVELYSAYKTFNELKNIEEFSFPCVHSVLSNLTIYVFYMGMLLRLGAFSEFLHDFVALESLSQEEQMDQKLGLELSDDELEDFQKEDDRGTVLKK